MLKRHENALNELLETVAHEGAAKVPKWRLCRWFGQERFTVGIRRNVRERWDELSGELPWISEDTVLFAETNGDIVLLNKARLLEDDE